MLLLLHLLLLCLEFFLGARRVFAANWISSGSHEVASLRATVVGGLRGNGCSCCRPRNGRLLQFVLVGMGLWRVFVLWWLIIVAVVVVVDILLEGPMFALQCLGLMVMLMTQLILLLLLLLLLQKQVVMELVTEGGRKRGNRSRGRGHNLGMVVIHQLLWALVLFVIQVMVAMLMSMLMIVVVRAVLRLLRQLLLQVRLATAADAVIFPFGTGITRVTSLQLQRRESRHDISGGPPLMGDLPQQLPPETFLSQELCLELLQGGLVR